ncbi:hypothetical protein ABZ412_16420 [Nocardia sp. NPDC005746]|uniref:hypothetical protein n=1 Tax=unclassified Nocardia TaxID=2637762 RepID=UPI0033C0BEA8
MRSSSDKPNDAQLRLRFEHALADAQVGIERSCLGLGSRTKAALGAIADATPDVPPELLAQAEAAFTRDIEARKTPRPPHL